MRFLSDIQSRLAKLFSPQAKQLKQFKKQHYFDKELVSILNPSKLPKWRQIKHLPKILSLKEKKRVRIIITILIISLVLLSFQSYLSLTTTIPKDGGVYTEALIGSPRFVNPILAQTNDVDMDLSYLVFSGLVKKDHNRGLQPDLATHYEISENQLFYTFYLRQDVKWHDGEPFKADDVIFTIASIQDPEFKSPLSRSFRGVTATKLDDYTVRFTLKEPFAPFLGLLTVGILPEHLWFSVSPSTADLAELNKRPVGTGAWKFKNFKKDKTGSIRSYTLSKNENYYGDKSYLEELHFKFYGDFISAVDALKSKDADAIAYLPKEYRQDLNRLKNLNYWELDQPQYTAIFFNQKENELLVADHIREALAYGINKQKIIADGFDRQGRIINTATLPGIETNPDIITYEYQPQKAVEIFEENNWQLTATTTPEGITKQIRTKKELSMTIKLTTVNQPENIKTAQIIKQLWEQLGISTELEIIDKSKIISEIINPRNYEALLFSENLGADPDPFPFWHSSQNEAPGLNLAIFSNKKVDTLLEDARKTTDWQIRQEKYHEFQKIIAEELPAIFLYNPTYTYPQDKDVKGFTNYGISAPADRFANINEWYVKTKRVFK